MSKIYVVVVLDDVDKTFAELKAFKNKKKAITYAEDCECDQWAYKECKVIETEVE